MNIYSKTLCTIKGYTNKANFFKNLYVYFYRIQLQSITSFKIWWP